MLRRALFDGTNQVVTRISPRRVLPSIVWQHVHILTKRKKYIQNPDK